MQDLHNVIDIAIRDEVLEKLETITHEHQVTIIAAIESGSRSWGFPSLDSDYDVRFVYAHSPEWYIQLSEERDVVELPVNEVLDIAGWDVRKAMQLANKGNSVIQEWLISPIIYRQDNTCATALRDLVAETFSAKSTFHHYSSMASNMVAALDQSDINLKRFFYIARATLSALWVVRQQSMPMVVFSDLLQSLTNDADVLAAFEEQIHHKTTTVEADAGRVHPVCLAFVRNAYREVLAADIALLNSRKRVLGNKDLRAYLGFS